MSGTHKILLGADKILIRRSSTAVVLTETVNRTFVVLVVLYTQLWHQNKTKQNKPKQIVKSFLMPDQLPSQSL